MNDGGKTHQSGGQQQRIDAGEEAGDGVLNQMTFQELVVCGGQNDGAYRHSGVDAIGGTHYIGQRQLQYNDNHIGEQSQMDRWQLLAAGTAGDQFRVTFRRNKANAALTHGICGPSEVENTKREGDDPKDNGHFRRGKGRYAQLLGQGDAQHGGGAGSHHVQNHGAVQEDTGHQELGYICFTEHGNRYRVDSENDNERVHATIGQQERDEQRAGYRGLLPEELKQEVGGGFRGAAFLH